MKPENYFFKEIKKLHDIADDLIHSDDGEKYWPFYFNHEATEEECFKRPDKLWQLKENIYTGRNTDHNRSYIVIFIWRIAHNYCTGGQPIYNSVKKARILQASETEKIIHTHKGYEFVWMWDYFDPPTKNVWGLRQGETYYVLRKNNKTLIKSPTKADFKRKFQNFSI
jgi:hypothetical protein